LSSPNWKKTVVGSPSGFTEPSKPAPESVTAVGASVSTGPGAPGPPENVAVTAVSPLNVTWQAPVPEQAPLQPANVSPIQAPR
jgi:hypothetical protein